MSDLIKKYEGLRLQAYKCPAGIWTIGYGTTKYPTGIDVHEGDVITKEYAEALLNDYLIKEVRPVFQKIPYSLTSHQKEALESLIYNVGAPAFLKSKLYKAICKKDWVAVFKEWDFGVKQSPGLIRRRSEELYLFFYDL